MLKTFLSLALAQPAITGTKLSINSQQGTRSLDSTSEINHVSSSNILKKAENDIESNQLSKEFVSQDIAQVCILKIILQISKIHSIIFK